MSVLLDTSEPSERAPRLLNRPRGKLGYASSVARLSPGRPTRTGRSFVFSQTLRSGTWSTYRIIRNRRLPHLTAVIILEMWRGELELSECYRQG